jgi:hypothetical protein
VSLAVGEFLRMVVKAIEDAGIPYMLTGSLASAFYATPRSTQDIDVVIDPSERALEGLVDRLSAAGCYVDRDTALEAWSLLGDSDRQRRDVVHLLEEQGDALDLDYIDRWVSELGLQAEWAKARRRASESD